MDCHTLRQGIFPTQGSNPSPLSSSKLEGGFFTTEPPGKPIRHMKKIKKERGKERAPKAGNVLREDSTTEEETFKLRLNKKLDPTLPSPG